MASPSRPFLSKLSLACRESFVLSLLGASFRGYCRLIGGVERAVGKVWGKIPVSPRKQGEEALPRAEGALRPIFESGLLVGSLLAFFSRVAEMGKDSFACNALKEAFWDSRERALKSAGLLVLGAGASLLVLEIIDRKAFPFSYLPFFILLAVAGLAFLRGGANLEEAYRRSLLRKLRWKVRDEGKSPSSDPPSRENSFEAGGEEA